MSSFTTELIVRHIDGKNWEVMEPFRYRISERYSNEIISIPVGYITDFASIPRFCWGLIGHPAGKHGKAAVVHDFLYSEHTYSRKRSDEIFYEAMGVSGVVRWRRKIIYNAVRLFGMFAWKNAVRDRNK